MTFVEDQAKAWTEIPQLTKLSEPQPETVNGPGATMDATAGLREHLPYFLRQFNVRTMLDVGCGDWTWMRHVDLSMLDTYIGWDVDPGQIAENQRCFGDDGRLQFECQNLLTIETMPTVDLILARHVLIHFPNNFIGQVLYKMQASGAKYLMTSHWPGIEANDETQPEGFRYRGYMERPVNLMLPPFNWPEPVETLREPAQPEAAILGNDHQLAVFEIPPRTFHTRVHSADDETEFSLMGVVEGWKERIQAMQPTPEPVSAPADEPADEPASGFVAAPAIDREMLRQLRKNHAEATQMVASDDSLASVWILLGVQTAVIDTILTQLIGDED